jgi:hypothetical protein
LLQSFFKCFLSSSSVTKELITRRSRTSARLTDSETLGIILSNATSVTLQNRLRLVIVCLFVYLRHFYPLSFCFNFRLLNDFAGACLPSGPSYLLFELKGYTVPKSCVIIACVFVGVLNKASWFGGVLSSPWRKSRICFYSSGTEICEQSKHLNKTHSRHLKDYL